MSSRKSLVLGLTMLAVFAAGLIAMFVPIFDGRNALEYMDVLYNSISKGSAEYIASLEDEVASYESSKLVITLTFDDEKHALAAAALFEEADATVELSGRELMASGDLAAVLRMCLEDSNAMFHNDSMSVESRYGRDGKEALLAWWRTLERLDKELKQQDRFPEAALVNKVKKKGVECAYNYYGIEPMKVSNHLGVVIVSLVFYVLYTVWYGFAIILVFEGCGLKLSH